MENFNYKLFKKNQETARVKMKESLKAFFNLTEGGGNISAEGEPLSVKTIKKNFKRTFQKKRGENLSLVSVNVPGFLNVPFKKGEEAEALKKAEFIFNALLNCSFYFTYKGTGTPEAFPAFLGLWKEEGFIYIDLSLLIEEEEKAALISKIEKQKAYFNFNKGVVPLEE
jgi:hypothetical protein